MKINTELFPLKAHYFFINLGVGPIIAFMPTIAKQIGFTALEVGTIFTISLMITIIARPFFGVLADKFLINKLLFILLQAILCVSYFCVVFIRPLELKASLKLQCTNMLNGEYGLNMLVPINGDVFNQDKWPRPVPDDLNIKNHVRCNMLCEAPYEYIFNTGSRLNDISINNDSIQFHSLTISYEKYQNGINQEFEFTCPPQNQSNHKNTFTTNCKGSCYLDFDYNLFKNVGINEDRNVTVFHQFWFLLICILLGKVADASRRTREELNFIVHYFYAGNKHFLYGQQRVWGPLGWGLACLYAGYLVDSRSQNATDKDYSILYYIMILFIGCSLYFSYKIKHTQQKGSTNIVKDVTKLFASPQIVIFSCWCGIIGIFTSLIWNFLHWHLEDLADANHVVATNKNIKTLQGLAVAVQCFGGEVPLFFLSGKILNKIGHIHAMSLVLFGFVVRFTCYSLITNPWHVLPIELLHGVTFSIFYATMASYASVIAPTGTAATLQGLVGAIFEGVGVSGGALIGGFLVKNLGGSKTFRYFGIVAFFVLCIHIVLRIFMGTSSTAKTTSVDSKTDYVQVNDNEKKDVEMFLLRKSNEISDKNFYFKT